MADVDHVQESVVSTDADSVTHTNAGELAGSSTAAQLTQFDRLDGSPSATVESGAADTATHSQAFAESLFTDAETMLDLGLLFGAQLLVVVLGVVICTTVGGWLLRRVGRLSGREALEQRLQSIAGKWRGTMLLIGMCAILGCAAWDAVMVWRGHNPLELSLQLAADIPPGWWWQVAWVIFAIGAGAVGAVIARRVLAAVLEWIESSINNYDNLPENDASLQSFFAGLRKVLSNGIWLAWLVFVFDQLRAPEILTSLLFSAITIYVIITVGLLVLRIAEVVVATCDGVSKRYAEAKQVETIYHSLRPLVPLFQRCLEYAIWVSVATLVVRELQPIGGLAAFGPPLLQAIAIFFVGRVAIELGYLCIERFASGDDDTDDVEKRRRATLVPLFKNDPEEPGFFHHVRFGFGKF